MPAIHSRPEKHFRLALPPPVETIGDAYVASCGCPYESDTHAEQIADQALDMMEAMDSIRTKTGVPTLRLRIGIHSGPITAGVIRAHNRRFQLFGDTMNTASRMESTGEPDCIQVSEATYKLLTEERVKRRLLLSERGLVEVKGKGALRNYWLMGRTGFAAAGESQRGSQSLGSMSGAGMDSTPGGSKVSSPFRPNPRSPGPARSRAGSSEDSAEGHTLALKRTGSFLPQWLLRGIASAPRPSPPLSALPRPPQAAQVVPLPLDLEPGPADSDVVRTPSFSAGADDAIPASDWDEAQYEESHRERADSDVGGGSKRRAGFGRLSAGHPMLTPVPSDLVVAPSLSAAELLVVGDLP